MSFFNSISQFVSDAGQSLNAGARKLVSSISQDSTGSEVIVTPNIEVSEDRFDLSGSHLKRPLGPMLIPSPEMVASMPLSPGVHFSRRRPSLGLTTPSLNSCNNANNPLGKKTSPYGSTLDPPINNLG